MKAIFRVITLFLTLSICLPCFAQSNEEITLTVSSDGPTKDDAIKNALRTAIEQAYGAFVSANTTILNDDLVKDEIVTISTGAIKNYAVVSEYEKKDGNGYGVTVNATVSLPHLVKYAQNHGSECEFAGNTFGMQMKLWELQKKNELLALEHLLVKVENLLPSMINWEIAIRGPKLKKNGRNFSNPTSFSCYIQYDLEIDDPILEIEGGHSIVKEDSVLYNRIKELNWVDFYEVEATIYATTFSNEKKEELSPKERKRMEMERVSRRHMRSGDELTAPESSDFGTFLIDNLEKIALTEDEASAMRNAGMDVTWIHHPMYRLDSKYLFFRNRESENLLNDIYQKIADVCCDFVIEDNMGNKADFYFTEIRNWPVPTTYTYQNVKTPNYHPHVFKGYGNTFVTSDVNSLSGIPFDLSYINSNYSTSATYFILDRIPWETSIFPGLFFENERGDKKLPLFELRFNIPKEDIGKYSSFKIVKK